jgi:3-dehydroquinate dehydratase type I
VTNDTHLAIAIAAADTTAALALARASEQVATLVEYRLDLMGDFDLARLLAESPLPAIITCRHPAQGGRFAGSERERRQVLRQAIALRAPFVDIEWDVLPAFAETPHPHTRIIGSQHDFAGMIGDWASTGLLIRKAGADIVKLVGTTQNSDDVLTPLAWLHGLSVPGIGIGMGAAGIASRLLAPRFRQAFLSFAAVGEGTAPGQIQAVELAQKFGYDRLTDADPLLVILTPDPVPWDWIESYRRALPPPTALSRPHIAPVPTALFGPGLWLALHLARVHGILCLPGVERSPLLNAYGLDPLACAWRFDLPRPFPAWGASAPDPATLMHFWLSAMPSL